ncbi:MAG TPA: response regulator transcription factor [Anaerolineales bacterium]|nr:response regulator transcription factor [Anaerolineales bacterium]
MSPNTIRVVLVDDHDYIHRIVTTILSQTTDIKLVGHAKNGEEAIWVCEKLHPDVVLMDVLMPGINGLEATKALQAKMPNSKILILTSLQDQDMLFEMLRSGAAGYVLKTTLKDDLAETINMIHRGKMVFSPEAFKTTPSDREQTGSSLGLTKRELDVLRAMADGMNMPETAARLKISATTAKFHMENICGKLGVRTRSQALIIAVKLKLI